ncbi:MBL fold metallo-hydrolase [bacterium]|nr:MBL fold metallo-hydrolase [bacterium]
MKLLFLGATGTVTGSRYVLDTDKGKILVDCGIFQGAKALRMKNWEPFPIKASELLAIVLTHAHIDHSGYIPRLVREGFRGKIYCTPPTTSLCRILLFDSAKLMEQEALYANKKGFSKHKPALPLFTTEDAERALEQFHSVNFHETTTIPGGARIHFKYSGHILGAASVRISNDKTSITFSGDVGRLNDPVMPTPENLSETDYLVVESTYGNRIHPKIDLLTLLSETFQRAWLQRGSVLIPAFAVGRAQQILYYISKLQENGHMPDFPIYLDSPMALDTTHLYCDYMKNHRLIEDECVRMCKSVKYVREIEESKALQASSSPKIVISASGMATGGRVLHYLKSMLPDSRNIVLFAGFQASGTRGAALVSGAKEVKIHGEYFRVNASVHNLENLSAHADSSEMIHWLKDSKINPKRVFITHGEPIGSEALKTKLQDEFKWDCIVPEEGNLYEL